MKMPLEKAPATSLRIPVKGRTFKPPVVAPPIKSVKPAGNAKYPLMPKTSPTRKTKS